MQILTPAEEAMLQAQRELENRRKNPTWVISKDKVLDIYVVHHRDDSIYSGNSYSFSDVRDAECFCEYMNVSCRERYNENQQ